MGACIKSSGNTILMGSRMMSDEAGNCCRTAIVMITNGPSARIGEVA